MEIKDDLYQLPTDTKALSLGYHVDLRLPEIICKFLESFRIQSDDYSGKAGRNFHLLPWQKAAIYTGYGWRRPDNRLRFTWFSWWLSRRQGKSIVTGGLSLFHALKEQQAETIVIASTKEQAGVVYNYADGFLRSNLDLQKRLKPVPSQKLIRDKRTNFPLLQVKSADKLGKAGTNTSLLLIDEWAEHRNIYAREMWTRLTPSLGSRNNSLVITISTMGTDKTSLAYEHYRSCKDLLEGRNDNLHLFPIVYELPEHENWEDKDNWWKCLPSVDLTVPRSFYLEKYELAKANPLEESSFRRNYLGQWVGSPECFIPSNLLAGCVANFNEQDLYGAEAILSCDYGASYDLTSWVLIVRKDDIYYVLPRFAIPKEVAIKNDRDYGTIYQQWKQDPVNHLYYTEGNTVDGEFLVEKVKQEMVNFRIKQLRYDKTRLEIIRQQIAKLGIETIDVAPTANALSPSYELLERLVRERKVRWQDNKVWAWNLDSCKPYRDKQNRLMISKHDNPGNKIDGVVATALGLTYFIEAPKASIDPPQGMQWAAVW